MAEDFEKIRKELEFTAAAAEKSRINVEKMKEGFASIGAELFDLSTSDFFKEIDRSPEEMNKLREKAKELKGDLIDAKKKLNEAFQTEAGNLKNLKKNLEDALKNGDRDSKILANNFLESLKNVKNIKDVDISKFIRENGEESYEFLKNNLEIEGSFEKQAAEVAAIEAAFQKTNKELEITKEKSFSLSNTLQSFIQKNYSLEKITKSILDFDKQIIESQRDSGIEMAKNSGKMTEMSIEAARFGVSVADIAQTMSFLGDALNTTNFDLLSKAAEDTMMISRATGLSAQEVNKLTANFMLAGKSSESVAEFSEKTMRDSQKFGLNTKKVIQDVSNNFPKFRQYGFQGGVESLGKMVQTAQRLRMNVDEIFNVAQRARSIEGAMEMAAELQLAGGSFAQIDPMQLLAAARKSPEELSKILGQMGKDIGKFDEKTGEVKFDPVDADRLEMVAKATGMTVESLQNQITKAKTRIAKEGKGLFDGFAGGGLDNETKDMLDQFSTIGKDGQIEFTGAFKGMNIDELRGLTQEQIKQKIDEYNKDRDTLEESAKQNAAFTESLTDLKNSFMNIFTFLEGPIRFLTKGLQEINSMPVALKIAIGIGVAAFMLLFSAASMTAKGYMFGQGFNSAVQGSGLFKSLTTGIKGMFGFGGGAGGGGGGGGGSKNLTDNLPDDKKIKSFSQPKLGTQIKQTLKGIAEGVKEFGKVGIKDVGMLIASAVGLVALTPAIPTLLLLQFVKGNQIKSALKGIADGFVAMGKAFQAGSQFIPFIFLAELALAGFGAALIPLTYALSLLSPLVDSFGKIIIGVFSLIPSIISAVAQGIVTIATGFGDLAMSLAPLAPNLLLLGPAFIVAAAGLTAFSFAAAAFGLSSLLFGSAFGELANLALLGPNLEAGGKGINAMATGVEKLSAALSSISDDTLDKLKAIGESIGDAAALTAAVNALTVAIGGGGKGGATQNFQIEVIVKNENGREIQRKILKDTDLLK